MNHLPDTVLLTQLKRGEVKAFDALFLKYYKMLCIHAYFYLKQEDEAKEMVQQLFVDFWEKKGYAHLSGDIKGYLYQSIKNKCLNQLRKQSNAQKVIIQLQRETVLEGQGEYRGDAERVYRLLDKALQDLPVQRREALTMVYLQDKRYQEAAHIMQISVNSLKTHLKLGLKNLRDRFKKNK